MKVDAPLLSVCLTAGYSGKEPVLSHAELDIQAGEILGLVGQSGSGKSTLALAILKLLELRGGRTSGSIWFRQRNLAALSESLLREVRGREIGLVLQSPRSSLNPALRVGTQLEEAWRAHARGSRDECRRAIGAALESVCLPSGDALLRRYSSQLSVGQAQRVLIAMAILHRPALLIADEPTSALDVITQAEILRLFAQLNRELRMAILYISHDLLSVGSLCSRVAILHGGRVVECATTREIFEQPGHSYTQHLIASLPSILGMLSASDRSFIRIGRLGGDPRREARLATSDPAPSASPRLRPRLAEFARRQSALSARPSGVGCPSSFPLEVTFAIARSFRVLASVLE